METVVGDGEAAKKKLYDAAKKGDVAMFKEVFQEDPNILDEVSFACARNVLHIATLHWQPAIVEEVLKIHPQLARDLDSKNSSFLHFAAAQGSCELATKLLAIAPETLWWRDWHDMNPIHVAAMNGHVEILEMMLNLDSSPAMERMHRGHTVLHLCMKHCQLGTLKVLAKKLGELVCAKDDDGETILHLAVRCNQLEAIQYLVEFTDVTKKRVRNSMGKTAWDILLEISKDTISNYSEIQRIFTEKMSHQLVVEPVKMSKITLVVAVLIATMAFQVSNNPPGGVWQDDKLPDTIGAAAAPSPLLQDAPAPAQAHGHSSLSAPFHRAGEAIMASTNYRMYIMFIYFNTSAFFSALITIILIMISRLSSRHNKLLQKVAFGAMLMTVLTIAFSFLVSVAFISDPGTSPFFLYAMIGIQFYICAGTVSFLMA